MRGKVWGLLLVCALTAPYTGAEPIDTEAIAAANMPAVVIVYGTRSENDAEVQGSGCCIHPDGYILATAHQAEGVQDFTGRFSDGTEVELTLVESRLEIEYALFKSTVPLPAHVALGDANSVMSGAPVVSIASPVGLEFSTVGGTVSNPRKLYDGYPVMLVSLTATHGSSGGPVFDRDGRLVGLISGGLTEADFTIVNKINNAYPLLEKAGLAIPAPTRGINAQPILAPSPGMSEAEHRAVEAYNRGVTAGDLAEKISSYTLAISLSPTLYEAHFNLAIAEADAGNLEAAARSYLKADELRPDSIEVKRNLGRLYLRTKQFDDAAAIFNEVIRLAPGEAQSHNDAGEASRRAGKLEEAVGYFTRSLELNPSSPGAHYNLALTYANGGQPNEAIEHFEAYLALAPDADDTAEVQAWITKLKSQ